TPDDVVEQIVSAPHDVVAVGRAPDDVVAAIRAAALSAPDDVVGAEAGAPYDVVADERRAPHDVVVAPRRAPNDALAAVSHKNGAIAPSDGVAPGVRIRFQVAAGQPMVAPQNVTAPRGGEGRYRYWQPASQERREVNCAGAVKETRALLERTVTAV